MLFINNDLQL